MFYGNITDKQKRMMYDLIQRGSCDSLKYMCNGIVMKDFQTLMTAWIIIMRTFICTLDTGLGKTIVASAVIKWLFNSEEDNKLLFVVDNSGLTQTSKKVREYTGLRVITTNAANENVQKVLNIEYDDYDILMISYQALQNYDLTTYMIRNISDFNTVIYDECQWLSELHDSNTWEITTHMRKHFKNVIMFSATPFRTNPLQLLKQVELINHNIIGNINSYIRDKCRRNMMYEIVEWFGLDTIKRDLTLYVNGFTRDDIGVKIKYNAIAHIVEPIPEQIDIECKHITKIKGYYGSRSFKELVSICEEEIMDFKQGIVYCSTNENKVLVMKALVSAGISCDIIDGYISNRKDRQNVISRYLDGEISVLVINVTTTLDLPSSFCVFYELCDAGTVMQFIGRCIRGLDNNDLDVHFILVEDTYEIDYFYDNVYRKSKYIQQCLGKDIRFMDMINKQLKSRKL